MSNRTQTPPNVTGYPKVDIFKRDDFNEALWENGYDVILEEAVACPCRGTSPANKPTCSNCLGTGWFFVNPLETRAFMMSINRGTKYKDWSPELIGTIAATFMNTNRFGFMDKIILRKNFGLFSETRPARTGISQGYGKFIFTTYRIVEVRSVFVFNGDGSPLIKLAEDQYRINTSNAYVLDIKTGALPLDFNGSVSISYKHHITYNIVDIPHDLRITKEYGSTGKRQMQEMPVQAIARKAQYELNAATNYAGNNIQNNSYL